MLVKNKVWNQESLPGESIYLRLQIRRRPEIWLAFVYLWKAFNRPLIQFFKTFLPFLVSLYQIDFTSIKSTRNSAYKAFLLMANMRHVLMLVTKNRQNLHWLWPNRRLRCLWRLTQIPYSGNDYWSLSYQPDDLNKGRRTSTYRFQSSSGLNVEKHWTKKNIFAQMNKSVFFFIHFDKPCEKSNLLITNNGRYIDLRTQTKLLGPFFAWNLQTR